MITNVSCNRWLKFSSPACSKFTLDYCLQISGVVDMMADNPVNGNSSFSYYLWIPVELTLLMHL
ncbi:unnamed protein product, partial [Heterobilharzia americana]